MKPATLAPATTLLGAVALVLAPSSRAPATTSATPSAALPPARVVPRAQMHAPKPQNDTMGRTDPAAAPPIGEARGAAPLRRSPRHQPPSDAGSLTPPAARRA